MSKFIDIKYRYTEYYSDPNVLYDIKINVDFIVSLQDVSSDIMIAPELYRKFSSKKDAEYIKYSEEKIQFTAMTKIILENGNEYVADGSIADIEKLIKDA